MAAQTTSGAHVPSFVGLFNPIALRLLRLGIRLGPNALITVRGRKSGLERTTPVALLERAGRRWIVGTFGDTNWVRNLRAAGEARLGAGRHAEHVTATELSVEEAEEFFTNVLAPYVRSLAIGRLLISGVLGAGDILEDPSGAARRHPVFELRQAAPAQS